MSKIQNPITYNKTNNDAPIINTLRIIGIVTIYTILPTTVEI